MARVIAGRLRGKRFRVPSTGTRPTSDRVREALFAALEARGVLRDAVVLDLYAGSGALGFEALSRGARRLVAVEASRPAALVLRANAADLGVAAELHTQRVASFLATGVPVPADLVLLDPPYDLAVDDDLAALVRRRWLAPGAVVVVERSVRSAPPVFPDALLSEPVRRYGDTALWLARVPVDAD